MSAVQPERPTDRFRRSAPGTIIAAGLLGVRDALEGRPESDQQVLEVDASGEPPGEGIELFLDPDHPERSIAVIHVKRSDDDVASDD